MRLLVKAHPIFRMGNAFANNVSGVGCLLRPIEDSGPSTVKTRLSGMTCKGGIVGVPENSRARGAREHDLGQIGLARVNPAEHMDALFEEYFLWPEMRCQHSLKEIITSLLLKDFGGC